MTPNNTKVFVVNKSAHDFSPAEKYGRLVYLSEGPINRYAINHMHRLFVEKMKDSHEDDWILCTSLGQMNQVASAIFAHKHGRLNLLLYKAGEYLERKLML